MPKIDGSKIKGTLFQVIRECSSSNLDFGTGTILEKAARELEIQDNPGLEQELLDYYYDLFRSGYLAWGSNVNNCDPPYIHVTSQGKKALEDLSRESF